MTKKTTMNKLTKVMATSIALLVGMEVCDRIEYWPSIFEKIGDL